MVTHYQYWFSSKAFCCCLRILQDLNILMFSPINPSLITSGDFIVNTDQLAAAFRPKNPALVDEAISTGKVILKNSGSKAAACRAIFELIHHEHREVILQAFMEGGEVTLKGAPTYFYNISKKFKRKQQQALPISTA